MIFIYSFPLDDVDVTPRFKKNNKIIINEVTYWPNKVDKLASFKCPNCGEHALFMGVVYIGCAGCLNYFNETDIINANGDE